MLRAEARALKDALAEKTTVCSKALEEGDTIPHPRLRSRLISASSDAQSSAGLRPSAGAGSTCRPSSTIIPAISSPGSFAPP